jgi:putative NIF3 family GTP cyclohydrolase 1 type 2
MSRISTGDVQNYLESLNGGWVDRSRTVDNYKSGGPEVTVTGIAVGWMSYRAALERAVELGANLFITHEPTYYNHRDNDETIFRLEAAREKREFIQRHGLTVIRCHDLWDQYPKLGIPFAWGRFLELGEPLDGEGYYWVYDGEGREAGDLACQIAERTATLGQPGVQFMGREDRRINRLALGTGAITDLFSFMEKHAADMAVCTDDGFTYWRDGAYAIDSGYPVAVVNHPVAEEFGMKLLAGRLKEVFPRTPVHHLPQKCMYKLIRGYNQG